MERKPLLGIFDSGVGGFSVYKQVRQVTSGNAIYYGDCLRAPYGNREEHEIVEFIKDDILFLQEKGVTHFVNACNSMSVLTTDGLLSECQIDPKNYVDMIRAFDAHATFGVDDRVLVIATIATIRSGIYQEALMRKGVEVFVYAYPLLASLVENNASREELLEMVEKSVIYGQEVGATHILYGCTHYPLLHGLFQISKESRGWAGDFIDPAVYVAEEIKKWNLKGERAFLPYSSKDTAMFIKNVIKFV